MGDGVVGSHDLMAHHILRHMAHVMRHVLSDQSTRVTFHLIVENNYAQAGRSIYEAVARIEDETRRHMVSEGMSPLNIEMYYEEDAAATADGSRRRGAHRVPDSHRVGFFTNNARKQAMVEDTSKALYRKMVQFHERFFTLRTDVMTSDQMRDGWFKQMVHFGYTDQIRGDHGSSNKKRQRIDDPVVYRIYSGKSGSADGNDDRVMATMIAYYAALEIEERHQRAALEASLAQDGMR